MSRFEEHTSHHNSFSMNNPASILSIEGNIGSGKSTLLEKLKAVYKDDPKMVFLDEPVKLSLIHI